MNIALKGKNKNHPKNNLFSIQLSLIFLSTRVIMKILFVLENYYPHIGGVETLFKNLCESLVKAGHGITVITTQKNKEDLRSETLNGVFIKRLPFNDRYLFTFFSFFPILKICGDFDLIQTTSYNAGLPARFAGFFRRKKVLITFHEVWGDLWYELPFMSKPGQLLHKLFEKLLLNLKFKKYIAVSQSTANNLEVNGVSRSRIVTIYNGMDYKELHVDKVEINEPKTFTYFGRLGMSKGIEIVVEAAHLMKQSGCKANVQLIVPLEPAHFLKTIKDLIKEKDLKDFIGMKHNLTFEELKIQIATSFCILLPSYSEGFCYAAVESMAIKTPIISSGRGALKEVVGGKYLEMKELSGKELFYCMQEAINENWIEKPYPKFELSDTVKNYMALYAKLV